MLLGKSIKHTFIHVRVLYGCRNMNKCIQCDDDELPGATHYTIALVHTYVYTCILTIAQKKFDLRVCIDMVFGWTCTCIHGSLTMSVCHVCAHTYRDFYAWIYLIQRIWVFFPYVSVQYMSAYIDIYR